jgi:hypothetical protein
MGKIVWLIIETEYILFFSEFKFWEEKLLYILNNMYTVHCLIFFF